MNNENLADFACRIYAHKNIERLSRQLQDHHYANINIILWLCWLDNEEIHLHQTALDEGIDLIGEITGEIVTLLRHAREQTIKIGGFSRTQEQVIGKNILQAEIAVEKILLERLQEMTNKLKKIQDAGTDPLSLFDYLLSLRVPEPAATAGELLNAERQANPEGLKS